MDLNVRRNLLLHLVLTYLIHLISVHRFNNIKIIFFVYVFMTSYILGYNVHVVVSAYIVNEAVGIINNVRCESWLVCARS